MVYIVLIVAFIFASLVPCKHALHMFQQNRYDLARYAHWQKNNITDINNDCLIPLGCMVISFLVRKYIVAWIVSLLVLMGFYNIYKEKKRNYIKPIDITQRVKRQIATMVILGILLGIFVNNKRLLIFLSGISPWLLIYPMGLITQPIEKYVQNKFKDEAKQILDNHTGLIKIGITGSYGKTSTKNVIQSIISSKYLSLMTPASFNTPMGITRTIREYLKPIHQVFVCEMGADHVGDITELMEFVRPSIGVVTSIGPQHLQTFGTQKAIIKEKMQMIEMLPEDGLGVLNYDNEYIKKYKIYNDVKTVSYGIRSIRVTYRALRIKYSSQGSQFDVKTDEGEVYHFETKLLGSLNILNILSAIAVARHLDIDWETIQQAVKATNQIEHRLELKNINNRTFIDDAFNANPSGAKMALEVLSKMPGTRYVVTPGMIDLGEIQDEENHKFGMEMKDKVDEVILVGDKQVHAIKQGLEDSGFDMNHVHILPTINDAFTYLWANSNKKDTILLENDLPDAFNK